MGLKGTAPRGYKYALNYLLVPTIHVGVVHICATICISHMYADYSRLYVYMCIQMSVFYICIVIIYVYDVH